METPSVPEILKSVRSFGLEIEMGRATFFLSRESLLLTGRSKMVFWRKALFAFISRNAQPPTAYFELPPGRVIELGIQIEI
jgi:KUP system potassium uptake protein